MSEIGTTPIIFPSDLSTPSGVVDENYDFRPRCHIGRTQTISDATWTYVSWDTQYHDTDSTWAIGSPTLITINTPGQYSINVSAYRTTKRTDYRLHATQLWADGGGGAILYRYGARNTTNNATNIHISCFVSSWVVDATADYDFSIRVYQDNTGNVGSAHIFRLIVYRIGGF